MFEFCRARRKKSKLEQCYGDTEAMVCLKEEIICSSSRQARLMENARMVAARDATVLLTGESGSGKEVLARYIHDHSRRCGKPYITCDCTSFSPQLLESTLFGVKRGAFTGAVDDTPGYMRSSHGGTIFFDEIGELDRHAQTRLLRFLEEKTVVPVGGVASEKIDVRIVAASNRDLASLARSGDFRNDLFYRLNVVHLHVEPLRQRKEDIMPLCEFFRRRFAWKHEKEVVGFTAQAQAFVASYLWPGNVRELRNAVERAVILCSGTWIDRPDIQPASLQYREENDCAENPSCDTAGSFDAQTRRFQRRLLADTLQETGGDRREAARRLGLKLHQLKYLIQKLQPQ